MPEYWASPEDFATLFQYFWHRDFPISPTAVGGRRIDWTIHIGVVVRNIADLMGLFTRFETGGRKDAVLRTAQGDDEIAIEWEWDGVWGGNELKKLRKGTNKKPEGSGLLKYAVLITYTHTPNIDKVIEHIEGQWEGARWPLLLILIEVAKNRTFWSGREFKNIRMSLFDSGGHRELRCVPAFPWNVEDTRWCTKTL